MEMEHSRSAARTSATGMKRAFVAGRSGCERVEVSGEINALNCRVMRHK